MDQQQGRNNGRGGRGRGRGESSDRPRSASHQHSHQKRDDNNDSTTNNNHHMNTHGRGEGRGGQGRGRGRGGHDNSNGRTSNLCRHHGKGTCSRPDSCSFKHGTKEDYQQITCPFQEKGKMCPFYLRAHSHPCWYRHTISKCVQWEEKGYCEVVDSRGMLSCNQLHDLTDKPLCSECGRNELNGKSHWKPLPQCYHVIDSLIPISQRKGGLSTDKTQFRCCGCRNVNGTTRSLTCDTHKCRKCSCPYCRECGSNSHTSPLPSCYHTGWWHVGRSGGWTPAEDGMAADWHCCGCDDHDSKGCDEHRQRQCSCFKNRVCSTSVFSRLSNNTMTG